jgi:hypothetical protein
MSTDVGGADSAKKAMPVSGIYRERENGCSWYSILEYVWFPCGIIRGALASLGVPSVVVAETSNLPQCTFQIKIAK